MVKKTGAALLLLLLALALHGCTQPKEKAFEVAVADLATGEMLGGAKVEVYLGDALVKSFTTDSAGSAFITGMQEGTAYYITASAKDHANESRGQVIFSKDTEKMVFQLEYIKAAPIPKGRFYEDALVSDALTGKGKYSGANVSVALYKTVIDDSGTGVESALFKLTQYGKAVDAKNVTAGQDIGDVFADINGNRPFSESIIVRSFGYDEYRQMGYADITISNS